MLTIKRLLAACAAAAILGWQLWVILPPGPASRWKEYYWPFVNYPMYARAQYRGDVLGSYRMTGTPCAGGPEWELSAVDVGLRWFRFRGHLTRVAGSASADPQLHTVPPDDTEDYASRLARLVRSQVTEPICTLHVWEQAIVLGEADDPRAVPWERLRSWDVDRYVVGEEDL